MATTHARVGEAPRRILTRWTRAIPRDGIARVRMSAGLALALSACGSGGDLAYVPDDEIVVSATLPADSPLGAYTTWGDGPTRIEVRPDVYFGLTDLLVHELQHAAGIDGHLGPRCYRSSSSVVGLGDPPCDEELAQMREVEGRFYVRVEGYAHGLEDATRWACDFWNAWTEREMFTYDGREALTYEEHVHDR